MKPQQTDKWLLALHEIARTINTPRTDNHTDGECLDAVWHQLVNLGINPDIYRPKPDAARVAVAYLGCGNECGHEQEFHGTIQDSGAARFACPNCLTWFEHSDWASFFDDEVNPAPNAIAPRALSVSESPTLTASAVAPLGSAVTAFNNCEGGEPLGWAVFCSDMSGQWIESGFTDEAGADRFAEHFTMYDSDHAASVGLLITDDRSLWDDVENRAGAQCVIVWNDTRDERSVFISFEPSDEDTPRDEETFYYSTHEEWEDLAQGNDHHDGWHVQEILNYTAKEAK